MTTEKAFLICPVRNISNELKKRIEAYVQKLEDQGVEVHWPTRDTEQIDPTGGPAVCRQNFGAIFEAGEIHIWYDETSGGSKFDMGGTFMLDMLFDLGILSDRRKIVIANPREAARADEGNTKSFFQVMDDLAKKTKE